ncbi:MAG: hypothetical protein ACYC28_11830 [Longimicrobiales bacterium]
MPQPGHFRLHGRAQPPLVAGDYVIEGEQSIPEEPSARFDEYRGHLRVTAPRFRLPPDHVLSTFPPANSEGAYETRQPQIVLRRRTLPWERSSDPTIPWLALVVIAEGEGELSAEKKVEECVTPGVTLSGPNDVATGVHLTVTQSVVNKVFPTKQDLPLLAHVREVDVHDTELAMGDDDGFLAVVLANRLPQFDRVECKPVRYLACLINLEGQLDALPPPSQPVDRFLATEFVYDAAIAAQQYRMDPDLAQMGVGYTLQPEVVNRSRSAMRATTKNVADGASMRAGLQKGSYAGAAQPKTAQHWKLAAEHVENVAVTASSGEASRLIRDAMKTGFRFPIEGFTLERVFRFPVLTHWSFTVTGAGGFESLMRNLDVGLLGTLPAQRSAADRAPCAQQPAGDAPPPTEVARPAPELAETGHVGLPHLTRRGEPLRAWYRGPLTPHVMVRDRDPETEDGRPPLAHTSDQLRRVVPDGREDLSLAAAFEIGRLLALSHPAIVAALMRWRREQFGAARAKKIAELAAGSATLLKDAVLDVHLTADLGRLLGRSVILASAKDPGRVLAPSRPLKDPARPIEFLVNRDIDEVLSVGFGIPLKTLHIMREQMDPTALSDVAVPVSPRGGDMKFDRETLQHALHERVNTIAADVLRGQKDVMTHRSTAKTRKSSAKQDQGPDALDELLDAAARRRREEVDG